MNMDLSSLYESLSFIKPELSISFFLLLIVVLDLIFNKNKKFIPFVAIAGIIVTGLFTIDQLGDSASAFALSDQSNSSMIVTDSFTVYFKLLILISSLIIIFFSMSSSEIKKVYERQGEYYALIFGMILGMMLMISSVDLILIYLSIELLSLSSYVLAGFTKLRDRNSEAALKYIIYGAAASGTMLFGISLLYGMTGTTNLYLINSVLQYTPINIYTMALAAVLVFVGLGFKISAVPFHFWTPDVYEGAPIAITAYLSVASKAAGFAVLIHFVRITFVTVVDSNGFWQLIGIFDWQTLLVIIALFTITLGNLTALWQNNLKRMLAYSSISHAGFILLGLAVLSDNGLVSILFYFFAYMIMNLGAFFIVMLIADKTGSEDLDDYDGLGYTSPLLAVFLSLFLISLTGIPPTVGFVAKLNLFIAVIDAKMITVAFIALLNTVVALYYYVRVLKHMYFTEKSETTPTLKVSNWNAAIVIGLGVAVLLFGIYFGPVLNFAKSCVAIFGM